MNIAFYLKTKLGINYFFTLFHSLTVNWVSTMGQALFLGMSSEQNRPKTFAHSSEFGMGFHYFF